MSNLNILNPEHYLSEGELAFKAQLIVENPSFREAVVTSQAPPEDIDTALDLRLHHYMARNTILTAELLEQVLIDQYARMLPHFIAEISRLRHVIATVVHDGDDAELKACIDVPSLASRRLKLYDATSRSWPVFIPVDNEFCSWFDKDKAPDIQKRLLTMWADRTTASFSAMRNAGHIEHIPYPLRTTDDFILLDTTLPRYYKLTSPHKPVTAPMPQLPSFA